MDEQEKSLLFLLPSISTTAGSNLQVRHHVLFKLSVIVRSRANVRVKERVIRVGRVRVSRRVAPGIAVLQRVSPREEAKVQLACVGTVAAALAVTVIIKVLHLHEPLGPELPPHPLTEHGQVDELSCRGQKTQFTAANGKWVKTFWRKDQCNMIIRQIDQNTPVDPENYYYYYYQDKTLRYYRICGKLMLQRHCVMKVHPLSRGMVKGHFFI